MSTATKSAKRSTPLVVGSNPNQQHRTKRPAPTKGGFFDAYTQDLLHQTQDILRQKHQKKDHKSRENVRISAMNGAVGKKKHHKHQNTKAGPPPGPPEQSKKVKFFLTKRHPRVLAPQNQQKNKKSSNICLCPRRNYYLPTTILSSSSRTTKTRLMKSNASRTPNGTR